MVCARRPSELNSLDAYRIGSTMRISCVTRDLIALRCGCRVRVKASGRPCTRRQSRIGVPPVGAGEATT